MGIKKKYVNELELVTTTVQIHKGQQAALMQIIDLETKKNNLVSISELHRIALENFINKYIIETKIY